ncbi:Glycosyltransferase involved in cell wall bisynthesis [Tistlia consotensis]|uniref:Glycosyltransferase involved in cell wall bisynthesis n=1 Tax=Tistlia consotensis USBA 355 TaxID=560819 RepID=A0A1Y6CNH8_9PROT|nr:glycosyltransferase family 1 protein [Tistlia consotensis]SMF62323.1 Glycosyltransferase involved in cell wall bisynthesis [Tistlia consotensis USBA 355]SNR94543.1 Glycosyltransferase involved in cell wall bisynthesis [Tistlia consotensis]
MRILLATDAWFPQINGVVRTLSRVVEELAALGHEIEVVHPGRFRTVACPTYAEIRLAVLPRSGALAIIEEFRPEAVHIATEGPIGWAVRSLCLARKLPFTTSYHTRFPEYVSARMPVPTALGYLVMRWFHRPSSGVMVATPSLQRELEGRGFRNVKAWSRGVDTEMFKPRNDPAVDLPRPVYLYVGRVSVEKNLEAFLGLDFALGSKLVVGDGPQLAELKGRFPKAHFVGAKQGEELARHYASADVFVFPSRTDTYGLVMLEALASGLPVAAFPVPGPLDVVDGHGIGVLDEDLAYAVERALAIPPERCRAHALKFSWRACAEQFLGNLQPFAAAA